MKCILAVGALAVIAATGAASTPNSFADARRVDVNENTEGMVMQSDTVERQKGKVDVIDSVRPGGVRYPYTNPTAIDSGGQSKTEEEALSFAVKRPHKHYSLP